MIAPDKFEIKGAEMIVTDVTDPSSLEKALEGKKIDGMISCLASRSGTKGDSELIDYQATSNCLKAGQAAGVEQR